MNFTDSPFEQMMKQVPSYRPPAPKKPHPDTLCAACSFWRGQACVGVCYRALKQSMTSGQVGSTCE